MTVVLLTGFEPFDGASTNPSWQAVVQAERRWSGSARLHTAELPVDFERCGPTLVEALDEYRPDLVVAVGQAGGRAGIALERVAVNIDDARIPDNAGNQPVDVPIVEGGPAAYFGTLPVKACVADLREAGIPAAVSQTAGTFTCNHVFYRLMHELTARRGAGTGPEPRGGFVHIPFAPEQASDGRHPSMAVDVSTAALLRIVDTSLSVTTDRALPGGALH
ncbi:pyroglutamyl-peptidase I [Actinoalloteichus hymeniacidonis]|uniref:Pyrrolidone-carboxylate peptidase n=1 Tax=Actinoalloteichus hymeniacidonis TaxID=340345 RepID=A0AAC9MXW8_9PSEU|nr:pyroglutamyl-peptidase I [Actinoalloteichus hymeniacidonis]AOS62804.1 pyroglutamyl-peptidase I [Actinoalloteichus hymeniacidonis]MBB5909165.1 pyroglutamyl-peptidase [Actinoalloteichus hymeniacidonis]